MAALTDKCLVLASDADEENADDEDTPDKDTDHDEEDWLEGP